MAYTNGIFHIDFVSGSDTARTALTGCVASNPSGSITRITKTAHGLVSGAVVDLTLFSTWLNDAWKITVVDADNFDLDGAAWQTTADADGTVTPRGGANWADAWATINSGATAARIQPGDEMRIAKTSEVSAGVNGTFTNASKNVTLSAALTKTIQNATTAGDWTVSTNISRSANTTRKIGTNAMVFTPAGAFTTGKVAYALVAGGGTQDFSAYQKISFWFRPTSAFAIAENTYKICLCSDTIGNTIVNEVNIPATLANTTFHAFTVDYGAALGNNIQSVAIYANTDPGTVAFSINNIIACNDVSLQSLVGPENEVFYSIQSIDETTLAIDSASNAAAGPGWSGTGGTYALYYANPILATASGTYQSINEAGTPAQQSRYSGGWDTGTNTRTGRTYFANILFTATALSLSSYIIVENFVISRYLTPTTSPAHIELKNIICSSTSNGFQGGARGLIQDCFALNVSATGATSASGATGTRFVNCLFANCATGISYTGPMQVIGCTCRNNSTTAVSLAGGSSPFEVSSIYMYKCMVEDTSEVLISNSETIGLLWSYDHDQTSGNHWGFTRGATVNWQTSVKQGSDPGSWRVVHSNTERTEFVPVRFKFAEIACTASSLVTVTVWVKKDHATNVGCKVFVKGEDYTLAGVVEDSETAANSTDWQQLTLTFTPTVAGIVPIWFDSFYISGNSNTYLGSITVTQ